MCVPTTFQCDFGISPQRVRSWDREGTTTLATPLAHSLGHSRYHPIASKWTGDERKQVMDIFRQGRGDNTEFKLQPAIPDLRNIMIGVAVELATTQAAKKIAEAEGDAKSMVTRAQGEADANRIRQNSLTPQLLDLRRIENSRALIDKWNGQLPTVESGQGSGMMLQLPKP